MAVASLVYFHKFLEVLESSPELKKTFWGIAKQVGYGAAGTIVGGACGGPLGALAGGVTGAVYGYANSEDYRSLIVVLKNLTNEEKMKLQAKIQELVGSVAIEDLMSFVQTEVNRQLLLGTLQTEVKAMRGG